MITPKRLFVRVATEFIELLDSMSGLEIKISRRGEMVGARMGILILLPVIAGKVSCRQM